MTFIQKRKSRQSKRPSKRRQTKSKRQPSKRRQSKRQTSKRLRKFRMSNEDDGGNNVIRMLIITRDVAVEKNRDKERLMVFKDNNQGQIIRNMELLQERMKELLNSEEDTSDIEKEIVENALEFKWLKHYIRELDTYIDKIYEVILRENFILPRVAKEPDNNKIKRDLITIKDNEINKFSEAQESIKARIKEKFLEETRESIEKYKNQHHEKTYIDSAIQRSHGFSDFLRKQQIKKHKHSHSPYKVNRAISKRDRQKSLIAEVKRRSPQRSSRKISHPKILKERL